MYKLIKHRSVNADIARLVFPAIIIIQIMSPELLRYMEIFYVICCWNNGITEKEAKLKIL
jgi:hypothetical protein